VSGAKGCALPEGLEEGESAGGTGGDGAGLELFEVPGERLRMMARGVGLSISRFFSLSILAKLSVKLSIISPKLFLSRKVVSCNEAPFSYRFSDTRTRF
jgi:hypothetical protein